MKNNFLSSQGNYSKPLDEGGEVPKPNEVVGSSIPAREIVSMLDQKKTNKVFQKKKKKERKKKQFFLKSTLPPIFLTFLLLISLYL